MKLQTNSDLSDIEKKYPSIWSGRDQNLKVWFFYLNIGHVEIERIRLNVELNYSRSENVWEDFFLSHRTEVTSHIPKVVPQKW